MRNPENHNRNPARPAACSAVAGVLLSALFVHSVAAQEVRPARPVQPPAGPGDFVPEVRPARPVQPPAGEPADVAPPPVAPAPPAGNALAPDPANDLLTLADMLYERGNLDLALIRYDDFLDAFPRHERAREALFRSAECLRRMEREADAEQRYALLVDRFRQGPWVGQAALRAAALAYNRRDHRLAIPYFRIARMQLEEENLKLEAAYRLALCLQLTGSEREAARLFQEVAEAPGPNPNQLQARLALARLQIGMDKKEEALAEFNQVAAIAQDPEIRGEALVRAGLIETDLGRVKEADKRFREVLSLDGADSWKPVAQFGLIRSRYQAKDYEGVVEAYHAGVYQLSDEMRAQMFLMTGNAMQRLGRLEDAVKVYGILENFYQGKPEGQEAGYRRIESLYRAKDPNFTAFVDHYVRTERERAADHGFLDRALFLKAEVLFEKGEMAEAATAYAAVRVEELPAELRAPLLYKMAWAEGEAGLQARAIESLGRYLAAAPPDEPRRALALSKRGELLRSTGENARALQDFTTVIEKHGDSEAAEFAYIQAASIRQTGDDIAGMVKVYEQLLEKFPETKAAPEAHYWIGRGYYQLKDYAKAIPALRAARDADSERYARPAGSRLVLSAYSLKDQDTMRQELDVFLEKFQPGELPSQVIAWLGVKLFEEDDPAAAARYLTLASNPEEPKTTLPVVWKFLAKARLDSGDHAGAVEAATFYLDVADSPSDRANSMLDKSRALFKLERYEEADKVASDGQQLLRQGRVNALLSILRGDIAVADGRPGDAAKIYAVVSQTLVDPELTPLALVKLIDALNRDGRREEAARFRKELGENYPLYKLPVAELPPGGE